MDLSNQNCIVSTEWLADNIEAESLRIIEATSFLPNYFDESASETIKRESGLPAWSSDHIRGSIFVDLVTELSNDLDNTAMYGLPSINQFESLMSSKGIDNNDAVVIYDRSTNMWAARLWWLFRFFGFNNAVVLNGGYSQWVTECRPIDDKKSQYPKTKFKAKLVNQLISDKDKILKSLDQNDVCLVNALLEDEFAGKPPHRYTRGGRIPGSKNIPFNMTVNVDNQFYVSDEQVEKILKENSLYDFNEVVCYCGGGIAACNTALLLTRMGISNVSVYDGSMKEWGADLSLPIES